MKKDDLLTMFNVINRIRTVDLETDIFEYLKDSLRDTTLLDREYLSDLIELRDRLIGIEVQIDQIRSYHR